MQEPDFKERRKFRRFVITIPSSYFQFELNRGNTANTKDISCNGLGFITNEYLPLNTRLNIWIQPPDNEKQIFTQGIVIWSCKVEFNKYRIGINLDDPGVKPLPIVLRTIQAHL